MTTTNREKRDYTTNIGKVYEHYRKLRTYQTVDFVNRMKQKYLNFNCEMGIWEAFDALNEFVDSSDPDLIDTPNLYHAFQTAEAIRRNGGPEWMQVTGLIHDLGKVLFLKGTSQDGTSLDEQYAVGGDTFIVGCSLSDKLVLPQFNELNGDSSNELYNTKYGMYEPHCGFDRCQFSFGHDEYLYQMLVFNRDVKGLPITLPDEAFYIIRYHSFYPWHQESAYSHLASDFDIQMQETLKKFSNYDLYTKSYELPEPKTLKNYYNNLIVKFLGKEKLWF